MKERPILFSAPMIRALLDGRKTQTRRVVTTREPLQFIGGRGEESDPDKWGWFFDGPDHHGYMVLGRGHDERRDHGITSIPCPYGEPGDRLWVRETWDYFGGNEYLYQRDPAAVIFRADECPEDTQRRWRPSIFMPRWASRITLEVSEVRVQRLQSISEDDARAEGVHRNDAAVVFREGAAGFDEELSWTARGAFAVLWDSINGKPRPMLDDDGRPVLDDNDRPIMVASRSWSSNPWVWAIAFRRMP